MIELRWVTTGHADIKTLEYRQKQLKTDNWGDVRAADTWSDWTQVPHVAKNTAMGQPTQDTRTSMRQQAITALTQGPKTLETLSQSIMWPNGQKGLTSLIELANTLQQEPDTFTSVIIGGSYLWTLKSQLTDDMARLIVVASAINLDRA